MFLGQRLEKASEITVYYTLPLWSDVDNQQDLSFVNAEVNIISSSILQAEDKQFI